MLAILGCDCYNGLTLSQHFLQQEGVADWLSVPTYRGKQKAQEFLREVGDIENFDGVGIQQFLSEISSYSIIVGYDDTHAVWVNIGRGDVRSKALAKQVVQLFA